MRQTRLMRSSSRPPIREQRMERVQSVMPTQIVQENASEQVQSSFSQLGTGLKLIGSATKGAIKSVLANKEGN